MSTAYHPQTNGQIEYIDQILEHYLRCYVDYNLKTGQTCYQVQSLHTTIKHMKKQIKVLEYSRNPRAGPILVKNLLNKNLNNLIYIKRQEALEQAKQLSVLKQKEYSIMCPVLHANKLTTYSEPTINKQKLLQYHQSNSILLYRQEE